MLRRPPIAKRTYTSFPYSTRFRSAVVQVVHGDYVVAAVEQFRRGRRRRHARGEGEAAAAALEPGHAALVGEAGGVVGARVLEALVHARAGLGVGGGGVEDRKSVV